MSQPVVPCRASLQVQDFQRNSMFLSSQSLDIISMLCPWPGTSPSNASLDAEENDCPVGQRWQCVRLVQCAELAAGLYDLRGVEMTHA